MSFITQKPPLRVTSTGAKTRMVEHLCRLAPFGAFTQADIGYVIFSNSRTDGARRVRAHKLRTRLLDAGLIEPYVEVSSTGAVEAGAVAGDVVYKVSAHGRALIFFESIQTENLYANFTRDLLKLLYDKEPPAQLPRIGMLLANRWMHAYHLRNDTKHGRLTVTVGEYALTDALRFANASNLDSGLTLGLAVHRMPDGCTLEFDQEVHPVVGQTLSLRRVRFIEVERRFEDAAKHLRLFLHFDKNGDIRPVASPLFLHATPARSSNAHHAAKDDPSWGVLNPALVDIRIQIVRVVEIVTGPSSKKTGEQKTKSEAVTESYLLELAKLYYFGIKDTPAFLRTERFLAVAEEGKDADALKKPLYATKPREANLAGFRAMLKCIEVAEVRVHTRHGSITDDVIDANGALKHSFSIRTLDDTLLAQIRAIALTGDESASAVLAEIMSGKPAVSARAQTAPTSPAGLQSTLTKDARLSLRRSRLWNAVRDALRDDIIVAIGQSELDGCAVWAVQTAFDADELADILTPIFNNEQTQPSLTEQIESACHGFISDIEEPPTEATLEIAHRIVEFVTYLP